MFYGLQTRPTNVQIDEQKVIRTPFNCCSPDKKCRGSLPFKINNTTVWKFVYHDGEPDDGTWITKCVYKTTEDTIQWFEE